MNTKEKIKSEEVMEDRKEKEITEALKLTKEEDIASMIPRIKEMLIILQNKNNRLKINCDNLAKENILLKEKLKEKDNNEVF